MKLRHLFNILQQHTNIDLDIYYNLCESLEKVGTEERLYISTDILTINNSNFELLIGDDITVTFTLYKPFTELNVYDLKIYNDVDDDVITKGLKNFK